MSVLALVMVWEYWCLGLWTTVLGLRLDISVISRVAGLCFSSIFAVEADAIDGFVLLRFFDRRRVDTVGGFIVAFSRGYLAK